MDHSNKHAEPLLLKVEEAGRLLNLGRTTVFELIANDKLPGVVRFGRSVRISREALERWVREQAGDSAAKVRLDGQEDAR